ncbi:ribosomal protein L36e [Histomonas meleagridis]|uniref:ribosomal protein L36e n=1 Tax=Histomonas meleagridis TaxID=135588 RepID=UPI00355A130A|nr:ribosomal protein L36e [Histomonas meleagridis]KAH0798787.1 ribosomal protein L36e [Histomonas meleagridis]
MSGAEKEAVKVAKRKGSSGKRAKFVREVIHELAGWSPYERRAMDLIKLEKRKSARTFLKKRLGTHKRAMHKLVYLENIIQEENMQHHH